ncbi:Toll/interleukin-1 receptor domain-containing protein [Tanacetum coccineum]
MLKHLKSLEIVSCHLLEKLPEDIGRLQCLDLTGCFRIEELPEVIGCLEYFKELDITGSGITCLPKSIYQLRGLRIIGDDNDDYIEDVDEDDDALEALNPTYIMASTSTSSIQKSFKYDVFLSFRGEDTRHNFVSHLYKALVQNGIQTYKDDEKIEKGETIDTQLIESIEDSRFFIIVFSKDYAGSSWCLDELVKIMECRKTSEQAAYPVFYDVEPTEIRKQSGAVEKAFEKHENKEAAEKWRKALNEAGNLAGWESKKTANGDESKLIQIIVDDIFQKICSSSSGVDGNLVGMETRIEALLSSLELDAPGVRMIGIWGMGGGGKTSFEGSSFVDNVREVSKSSLSGLKELQKQILTDIFSDQNITVSSVSGGKNKMGQMMRRKKVLVVLDDVDCTDQLEALAGDPNWYKPGSRIIITTRDEQVLIAHRVGFINNVTLLSHTEAIRLFNRYAFTKETPIQGLKELSRQVVKYAHGLPLTIKVLGSLLCGQNKPEWKDALERLKTIPLKETMKILEISYDALDDDYKEIFLDVACLLKGWRKDKAGKLGMHDHIEEMGKNIVRRVNPNKSETHSRLWIREEIEEILANDSGAIATKCIRKLNAHRLNIEMLMKGLANMKELRFLQLRGPYASEDEVSNWSFDEDSIHLPNALRFLRWEYYPFSSLPKTFQPKNLVGLEMLGGKMVQLWKDGEEKPFPNLRFLKFTLFLLRTLDLSVAPNLESLILLHCWNMVEVRLSAECPNLESLNLTDCGRFESFELKKKLDSTVVVSLSELHLRAKAYDTDDADDTGICDPGNTWPEFKFSCDYKEDPASSFGNLERLISLGFGARINADSFSDIICGLQCLRKLTLEGGIPEAPKNLDRLGCLEELSLQSTDIKTLPDSICMLKHLKSLKLKSCLLLEKLPVDIGRLECLESLILSKCTLLQDLPNSIYEMKRLKSLELTYCIQVEKLPEAIGRLDCLKELNILGSGISHLPHSLHGLRGLRIIADRRLLIRL